MLNNHKPFNKYSLLSDMFEVSFERYALSYVLSIVVQRPCLHHILFKILHEFTSSSLIRL